MSGNASPDREVAPSRTSGARRWRLEASERRARRVGAAATVIPGVLVLLCLASCSNPSKPTNATSAPPNGLVRTTRAVVDHSGTASSLVATKGGRLRLRPSGASFVSGSKGWVLGSIGCQSCAVVWRTTNEGRTWTPLPNPGLRLGYAHPSATKVDDIYFANARDGYLYSPGLDMTRDGGKTWDRGSLPPVVALAGASGRVYALVQPRNRPVQLRVTRPGSQTWSRLSLPRPTRTLKLAVDGETVAVLEPGTDLAVPDSRDRRGRLWVSTDAGRQWQQRAVPCKAAVDGGATVISLALRRPQAILLDCFSNQQSSQEQRTQHHLFGSADAGRHWVRLANPTTTGAPVLLADNGAGHAFLTTEGVHDNLDGTLDHAQHWHRVLSSGGTFYGWNDLTFVTTEDGYVVGPTHYAQEHLYFTTDGGSHWRVMKLTLDHPADSSQTAPLANCRASQLSAVAHLLPVGAGSDEYRVTISDHGPACRLRGQPRHIVGVSAQGQRGEVHLARLPTSEEHAMLTGKPADLDQAHTADLVLVTGTACDKPATRLRVLSIAIGRGRLKVRYEGGPEPVDLRLGMNLECGAAVSPFEASFPNR